jgi:hypothetical protein
MCSHSLFNTIDPILTDILAEIRAARPVLGPCRHSSNPPVGVFYQDDFSNCLQQQQICDNMVPLAAAFREIGALLTLKLVIFLMSPSEIVSLVKELNKCPR